MPSTDSATALTIDDLLEDGLKIGGILFVWAVFAGVSGLIADLAPRHMVLVSNVGGWFVWFFLVVGLANVLLFIFLRSIEYHHGFETQSSG